MLTAVHHTQESREYCVKEYPTTRNENSFYDKTISSPLNINDPQLKAFLCFRDVQKCPKSKSQKSHSKENSKIYPGIKHLPKSNIIR